MSDNPLNVAVISRWSIKGLDSSIAPLYLGTKGLGPDDYLDEVSKAMEENSAPNEQLLPRARFVVLAERTIDSTPTCKTIRADLMFYLFGVSMTQMSTFRNLVRSTFENGHAQVVQNTNPFAISGAKVSDLDLVEFEDHPERHDIKYSELLFTVIYSIERNLSWPASVP